MRERAAFEAMPAEYRAIEPSPTVTRAQLAALLGVRLEDLLRRARAANTAVMTDVRGNWAGPWILAVTRAGRHGSVPQSHLPTRVAASAAAISRMRSAACWH